MPGTILLADLERANDDELRNHLQGLMVSAPTSSDSLTNPLGTGNAAPPQELQDHLTALLEAAPEPPPARMPQPELAQEGPPPASMNAPAGMFESSGPPPAQMPTFPAYTPPAAPLEPAAAAPTNVMDELANHVQQASGGALQLMGQGMTALGSGAQVVGQSGQNVISLVRPPAPSPQPAAAAPAQDPDLAARLGGAAPGSSTAASGTYQDYAREAARRAGIDPELFVAQIQQESGFNPNAGSPAGALGIAQIVPKYHPGVDPSDPMASLDYAANLMKSHLKQYGGDYAKALVAYNGGGGAVAQLERGTPYQESRQYLERILGGQRPNLSDLGQAAGNVVSTVANAARGTLNQVSQFGDSQLTASEASAACGPAAAVRFAQRYGRNPTLREATDMAATVGWTQGQGMAGIGSEKALLEKMGVPTKLVSGPDWGTFANEARSGNPVIISTAGHYFTADNWDPATNRFHVGRSGLDLRGGSEWMTPEEMTSRMGAVQGGLLADNPTTPASTITTSQGFTAPPAGGTTDQQAAQVATPQPLQIIGDAAAGAGQKANEVVAGGLRFLDSAVEQATTGEKSVTQPIADAGRGLAEAVTAVADSGAGQVLGALRGPALLSDEEIIQRAKPNEIEAARRVLEQSNSAYAARNQTAPDPVTDEDLARYLRNTQLGQAAAATGAGLGNPAQAATRASKAIDYEALAESRRSARAGQPGLPDMPNATESRLNREIAASVNNMFAVPSMVTNAIGGGIETIKRPVVTAFTGNLGAAGADLRAMGLGLGDAFADMGTTFRTGIRPSRAPSTEVVGQAAYEGQDVLKSGAARIGFLRGMEATDEFMRSLNSAGAQASEMARLMKAHPDLSQEELISRFGGQLMTAGERAAAESVYAVGGTGIGRKMSQWRSQLTAPDASPGDRVLGAVTNVLVPFSNIPDVILTKGIQRLPVVNELTMLRQLRSSDPGVRQRAISSAALAESVNVGIGAQVMEGNITGNGPSDPAKKAALQNARDADGNPIWQPNSVRIGGRWLPYASLGPVGVRMGAIANVTEQISDEMSKPNPSQDVIERAQSTALAILDGTSETIADAWYLQTVGRLFNAMKTGGVGSALGQTALSTAQRAIPYGGELRSIESATDPTVAEPRNPIEAIAAGIPGASQFAQSRIDPTTGRPLQRPADVGTLLTRSPGTGEPTPVDTALATHNIGVPDAPQTVTQGQYTVNITPDEQRQYTIEAGQRVEKNVQALLNNPRWSSQTQEQQKDALRQAIGAARADAAALVWRSIPPAEQDRRVKQTRARQAQEAEPVFRAPVTTP